MIYIERNIRIKNNEAQIEQPIILYKGDMNIELQFTITNNPFKYKPGMDVTYGQLIIKRPNNTAIFSEPAKLSSSKVLFTVTGDMIDELEELGAYDFQIQLLNSDQTSKGSLPPVYGGIDIREPLCEPAITNRASVNSRSAFVMRANDGIMLLANESDGLFDSDGDYNRTNWRSGDVITDTRLNKIEEALYQINDDIPTDYATREYVDDTNRVTRNYIIDNYPTKAYVNNAIGNIDVDLTGYATEDYVNDAVGKIEDAGYAKESYVTDSINSNNRYIESYILRDYATEEYVDEAIKDIEGADLTNYATKDYVTDNISHSLSGYATESYVDDMIGDINAILDAINGEEV